MEELEWWFCYFVHIANHRHELLRGTAAVEAEAADLRGDDQWEAFFTADHEELSSLRLAATPGIPPRDRDLCQVPLPPVLFVIASDEAL